MEKEGSLEFVLIRVPPKPRQELSVGQTRTFLMNSSSFLSAPATELWLLPSVVVSSSCVQENQKGKQESRVSTKLSLSIPGSFSDGDRNKSQGSVALSNLRKLCSKPPKNASHYDVSTELSLSVSSTFCDGQNNVKHHTALKKRKSCPNPPKNAVKRLRGSAKNRKEMRCCNFRDLNLNDDLWKIKKVLTGSDVGNLCRLLLATDLVEKLMLPYLGVEAQRDAENLEKGIKIGFWDVNTKSMHDLILKHWISSKSYVLIGGWNTGFVKRRCLKKGHEIGLRFDTYKHCFDFCILKRA
ncbi:hypothetical protein L6164_008669 [Bauhinia variegata]|uniref:Uncharacterized protein n=1 Tax=Bauhinia variegata TaxID=167791 RepID=A0ACB9PH73_BAUVA|nr:hypothetical protein L6164_008669 [Bauhinia variegata]